MSLPYDSNALRERIAVVAGATRSGELAQVYGFTDLDGTSPDIWQHMEDTEKD